MALAGGSAVTSLDLPWEQVGLTESEAAAHLLNRLTFGPRPGDLESILEVGLERWLQEQLDASEPDRALRSKLADFSSLQLDVREFPETYPNPRIVLRQATEAGISRRSGQAVELEKEAST